MRTLVKEIESVFRGFLRGAQHTLLLISCEPEHSPLLLKTIEAIEDDSAVPDIFLTFGHPFENSESYVGGIFESLTEQLEALNKLLVARGDPTLSGFSNDVTDPALPPESRLLGAVRHIRSVVPRSRQIVWVLYPLEIAESPESLDEYLLLVNHARAQIREIPVRGTKLIVRDSSAHNLVRRLRDEPDTRFYLPPLDPDSMSRKLKEAANDASVPHEEQAQIHMMLAGMDVANGNFDQALTRNEELLGYFYHTGQKHHQSVVHNNIGDINYMQGNYQVAQQSYEQAILIAAEQQSQPLVTYQSINLGNSLLMQKKYDEALTYYESAEQLAGANKTLPYQVQALERIGELKYQSGNPSQAAEAWQKAADLCSRFHYDAGLRPLLDRLLIVYREIGDKDRLNECRKALADLVKGTQ